MRVSASQGRRFYSDGVFALLFRLLTVVALVLMPFGMLGAPASATAPDATTASMSCDGHHAKSKPAPESQAHCPSCLAIPAPGAAAPVVSIRPAIILADRSAHLLLGLEPDVATPPPKRA